MAKFNLQALAGALNEGGSIFGELGEHVAKVDILKNHTEEIFVLGRFEVRTKTKKHKSAYVTLELAKTGLHENGHPYKDGEYVLFSGYATALGSKLLKLAEMAGKVDGVHAYIDEETELPVFFKVNTSPAGEYLDLYAWEPKAEVEEATAESSEETPDTTK